MAHNKQYKSENTIMGNVIVKGFDYPKRGELFWNRYTHRIENARKDMNTKYLILEEKA